MRLLSLPHPLRLRLVLAWFALALGAAAASPLVAPRVLERLCSSAGVQWHAVDDGTAPSTHATLECPLCLGAAPPPSAEMRTATLPPPQGRQAVVFRSAGYAARSGGAFPPRAPPAVA